MKNRYYGFFGVNFISADILLYYSIFGYNTSKAGFYLSDSYPLFYAKSVNQK